MRIHLILTLAFCFAVRLSAQEVQWASEVVSFSSQYADYWYSAKQILGVPNSIGDNQTEEFAWWPKKANSSTNESIKVRFNRPVRIQQIAISESKNPGAISKIFLFDTRGGKHLIYENKDPKPLLHPYRMLRHKFAPTSYKVKEMKVELETDKVPGYNQIDAVAISTSRSDIRVNVREMIYGEEVNAPENLGPEVNSAYDERLPIISPDGKTLFFARKRDPKNVGTQDKDDIWVSYLQKSGQWSTAVNAGAPLNNQEHNFVVASSPKGDLLYLANDYSKGGNGLSASKKKGESWSAPRVFKIEEHYNTSPYVSYHLSVDGKVLLMSVQREEGFGFRDLYVSFRKYDDRWSKPKNLGPVINSRGEESSVFLAADGKTIYFSSSGHFGYGGLDMFMSKRLDNSWTKWSAPKNMGKRINTPGNDYNFTIPASGDYAYFSSNYHTYGGSDLFRIQLPSESRPEPVKLITGRILDKETGNKAELKDKPMVDDWLNDDDGTFTAVVPQGQNQAIHPEIEGYYAVAEVEDDKAEEMDFDESILEDAEAMAEVELPENKELDKLLAQLNSVKTELNELKEQKQEEQIEREADPELEALRMRYATYKEPVPRPTENASFRPVEDQQPVQDDYEQSEPRVNDDPEIEAMRRRYAELNEKKSQREKHKDSFRYKPSDYENPEVEEAPDEEYEEESLEVNPFLAALKEKEKKPRVKKESKRTSKEEVYESDEPSEELTEIETQEDPEEHFPTEPVEQPQIDFEQLEKEVRDELRNEYRDQVIKELESELDDIVKEELSREMEDDLKQTLRDSLRSGVESDLRQDLANNVEDQLKQDLSDDVRSELKDSLRGEVREELIAQEKDQIEDQMRDQLVEEIKEELKVELSGPVKRELKRDMEYVLKKELEAKLRKELEEQIRQQLAAEYGLNNNPDEVDRQPVYEEVEQDIFLVPIKVGQVIPMNNIFFDANEATLKEESFTELSRAVLFLAKNDKLIIEVGGHTNGWCSHEFANELSHERAQTVSDYFASQGIPKKRIQFHGYGKTHPIAPNNTVGGRKKNQRVELKILEILE